MKPISSLVLPFVVLCSSVALAQETENKAAEKPSATQKSNAPAASPQAKSSATSPVVGRKTSKEISRQEIDALKKQVKDMQSKLQQLEQHKDQDSCSMTKEKEQQPPSTAPPQTHEGSTLDHFVAGLWERLKISGQIRVRGEFNENVTDFDSGRSDEQEFALLRVRLRLSFHIMKDLDAVIEFQDARRFGDEGTPVSTARGLQSTDLSLGYLDFNNLLLDGLTLRVGRQALSFGDQRLVGAFEYNNFANRFDAASIIYRVPRQQNEGQKKAPDLITWHSFLSVLNETTVDSDDTIFAGSYFTVRPTPASEIDFYYFLLDDNDQKAHTGENGVTGNRLVQTVGSRIKIGCGAFGFVGEGAYQFGSFSDDRLEAFAVSANLSFQERNAFWKPKVVLTYNYATGDEDPNDGVRQTFENLFPTNHLYYGFVDLFSWSNLENAQARIQVFPAKGLTVFVDYHYFLLATTNDFHYNAGRKPVRKDLAPRTSTRRASRTAGQEIDVSIKYKLNKHLTFFAQYGHFFAGPYYRSTQSKTDADFAQFSVICNF